MARFRSTLKVSKIKDGKWRLLAPLGYESDVTKRLIVVPKGFETDFASVPRLPFMFWFLGDRFHASATVHDWLYSTGVVSRSVADAVLEEAMKVENGITWLGRKAVWFGVRVGGWNHYHERHPSSKSQAGNPPA